MIIDRRLVESVLKNNANLAFKGCSKNRRGIFARPCAGSPFCPVFLATQKNRSPVGRDRRTLKQSIDPKQTRQALNDRFKIEFIASSTLVGLAKGDLVYRVQRRFL
jgi:hypothetical protein